eukprot:3948665-Prymnesium_polylepis.3
MGRGDCADGAAPAEGVPAGSGHIAAGQAIGRAALHRTGEGEGDPTRHRQPNEGDTEQGDNGPQEGWLGGAQNHGQRPILWGVVPTAHLARDDRTVRGGRRAPSVRQCKSSQACH